jgi:Family of unknown function (DUF5362)
MAGNPNAALSTASKPQVIGALKATGSTDPDVLFAAKQDLLDQYKPLKTMSWILIICGVLICLTLIGAIIGVPMILLGWWLRRKCNRNIATVEAGFAEYLSSIGVKAPIVAAA